MKVVKSDKQFGEKNVINFSHKNIVKTISIINSQIDNYGMVLMEYFPNSIQLQKLVKDFEMDMTGKIVRFSIDICRGLEYCHNNKILHLDIKPHNILVCGDTCKICDFGSSACEKDLENCYEFKVIQSVNNFCYLSYYFFRELYHTRLQKYCLGINPVTNAMCTLLV